MERLAGRDRRPGTRGGACGARVRRLTPLSPAVDPRPRVPSWTASMSKTACIVPWTNLAIGPDGRATFCCDIPTPLTVDGRIGSVYRGSLDELWNAPEVVQVRAALARGERPPRLEARGGGGREPAAARQCRLPAVRRPARRRGPAPGGRRTRLPPRARAGLVPARAGQRLQPEVPQLQPALQLAHRRRSAAR